MRFSTSFEVGGRRPGPRSFGVRGFGLGGFVLGFWVLGPLGSFGVVRGLGWVRAGPVGFRLLSSVATNFQNR